MHILRASYLSPLIVSEVYNIYIHVHTCMYMYMYIIVQACKNDCVVTRTCKDKVQIYNVRTCTYMELYVYSTLAKRQKGGGYIHVHCMYMYMKGSMNLCMQIQSHCRPGDEGLRMAFLLSSHHFHCIQIQLQHSTVQQAHEVYVAYMYCMCTNIHLR